MNLPAVFSDIQQLSAAFHLKALGRRWFLEQPIGSPDWGFRQKSMIGSYLLTGRKGLLPVETARALEEEICRVFSAKFCIATGSGREAIKLALLGMGVLPGERVVLPSFCCLSVLLPVLELGLEPVLADVGDDLQIDPESVRRVIRPGDRALIVPHLFGSLADMPTLVDIASANGARCIDDAAQAIGLHSDWGWAGRGGDAGVFSFGSFKPLNAMGGGALLTDDEELYVQALNALQHGVHSDPSRVEVIKIYVKTVWRKYSYRLFLYHRLRQQGSVSAAARLQVERNFRVNRIGALHAQLAASQLSDFIVKRHQATEAVETFKRKLAGIPFVSIFNCIIYDGFPRFVVRMARHEPSFNYAKIFNAFLQIGVEVQPTYRPLHRILKEMRYQTQGEFARSEDLAEELICLPSPGQRGSAYILRAIADISKQINVSL